MTLLVPPRILSVDIGLVISGFVDALTSADRDRYRGWSGFR